MKVVAAIAGRMTNVYNAVSRAMNPPIKLPEDYVPREKGEIRPSLDSVPQRGSYTDVYRVLESAKSNNPGLFV